MGNVERGPTAGGYAAQEDKSQATIPACLGLRAVGDGSWQPYFQVDPVAEISLPTQAYARPQSPFLPLVNLNLWEKFRK